MTSTDLTMTPARPPAVDQPAPPGVRRAGERTPRRPTPPGPGRPGPRHHGDVSPAPPAGHDQGESEPGDQADADQADAEQLPEAHDVDHDDDGHDDGGQDDGGQDDGVAGADADVVDAPDRDGDGVTVGADGMPRIRLGVTPAAIRTLKAALRAGVVPQVYVKAGSPVRIERVSGTGSVDLDADAPLPVQASPLTSTLLAALLAEHTFTYRLALDKDTKELAEVETTPTDRALSAALAGAEWPKVPTLAGIIGTPVLRRDWSLLQAPGYDPASGLFLAPTVDLPSVPARPAPAQVDRARAFLLTALLGDFEWEDEASRANYIALMVTPYLRRPLKALVPLAVLSASAPGSGKSLLSGVIGLLVGQQTVPWPGDDDAELKKLITSTFTTDIGAVIFDNLTEGEQVASPTLANLLTNPVWSDRILGRTGMGSWPNERLWMVTGNNLRVGGDIASRSVYVRLKPACPHPEERTGFVLGDLEAWLKDPRHRAELLWRLLVLVADWVAAGTPRDTGLPAMRQFTAWAHGAGGFLAHHGIGGFLTNLRALRGMDEEDRKWAVFLDVWRDRFGAVPMRPIEVMDNAAITRDPLTGRIVDPWDGDFITDGEGVRPRSAQKLGKILGGQVDRWHGDPAIRLRAVEDKHGHTTRYWVEEHRP